jgi:glycosyltransferase involved in cell wall biosynthesis
MGEIKRQWVATTTLTDNLLLASFIPLLDAYPDMELVFVTDRVGQPLDRLVYVVPSPAMNKWLGRLGSRWLLLWKTICKKRVERVVCFLAVPHLLFVSLPAWIARKPIDLHMFAGRYDLDFADNPSISDNRYVRRMKHPVFLQNVFRWLSHHQVDRFFCPGIRTHTFLEELGLPKDRITNLHSSINVHKYHPGDVPRDIDVLIVARIATIKRPLMTLEILEKALAQKPGLKFAWLGRGEMENEVKAAAAASPLKSALTFVGHIEEVWPYYQRAKTVLLNSSSEGLSTAIMEGMASGCVPISSDVGDMAEVVRTGETGILVTNFNEVEPFVDGLVKLLSDDTDRERLSRRCRELIVNEHSFEAIVKVWQDKDEFKG